MNRFKVVALKILCVLSPLCFWPMFANATQINSERAQIIDMDSAVVAKVGEVEFRECTLEVQGRARTVQCAWVPTFENPNDTNSATINLFVVRLPAKRESKREQDPMLFLAGGPGQAASETFLYADHIWSALATKRDFYLIDQRGTGYSNFLDCSELIENKNFDTNGVGSELTRKLSLECLAILPGDMRFYTTDNSIKDFEKVREALAIKQWNLLGVSYGTRVATHYMRAAEHSVRSVVLDSVVPPSHVLGLEIELNSQKALDALIARCKADPSCNEQIPDFEQEVQQLLERLQHSPVTATVENFATGNVETVEFTREQLVMLIRLYLYNPMTVAVLPPILHQASKNNNYAPLVRAAKSVEHSLAGSISAGLHHSIICSEEFPFFPNTEEEVDNTQNTYMGGSIVSVFEAVCSVWPRGEIPQNMKQPLQSNIPTLLFSGEYDPITPPSYGEQTVKELSNAKHLILKGQGHFVSGTGCAPNIINDFIAGLDFKWVKSGCLNRVSEPPLFVNFNGSAP